MEINEFIEKLEADGGWEVRDGSIRRTESGCCPIEHVAGVPPGSWDSGAIRLNLRASTLSALLRAADRDSRHETRTRARLLKACGLESE